MWRRHARQSGHDSPQPTRDERVMDPAIENEFDAYLAGRYVEWARSRGRSVPTWAWVNRVAHATMPELERLVHPSFQSADGDVRLWDRVVTFLAEEILNRATDEPSLQDVQQRVLIPVELCLAEDWAIELAPIDLATLVMVALQNASNPTE